MKNGKVLSAVSRELLRLNGPCFRWLAMTAAAVAFLCVTWAHIAAACGSTTVAISMAIWVVVVGVAVLNKALSNVMFPPVSTAARTGRFDVRGRHVFIMGGSKGVGLALGHECVRRGANIVTLAARNIEILRTAQKELLETLSTNGDGNADESAGDDEFRKGEKDGVERRKIHTIVQIVSVDVALEEQVKIAFAAAQALEGEARNSAGVVTPVPEEPNRKATCPVDVLILSSTLTYLKRFDMHSADDVGKIVRCNLLGNFQCCHQVVESMRRRRFGVIAVCNSEGALCPFYGMSLYAAGKCAMRGFLIALAQELQNFNVLCTNAYLPSVDTPGYAEERLNITEAGALIEGESPLHAPDTVATHMMDSISAGHTTITFDVIGWILAVLNGGNTAVCKPGQFLLDVAFGGVARLVMMAFNISCLWTILTVSHKDLPKDEQSQMLGNDNEKKKA
eukprot:GHVT01078724.1.p1 GENE.GHVT01078724.1~~GHVT01078724.1.p1  ORF type:complete len:451 (+),score=41.35 GHVT01078724.1:236-1588(+)